MQTRPKRAVTWHPSARRAIGLKPSTASAVEHRMPLNSGAISYTKAGTGPVVLLIHGLGGTRRTWQHLIPGLARTHTVIAAPDLPGHGLSDPPAGAIHWARMPARCGICFRRYKPSWPRPSRSLASRTGGCSSFPPPSRLRPATPWPLPHPGMNLPPTVR